MEVPPLLFLVHLNCFAVLGETILHDSLFGHAFLLVYVNSCESLDYKTSNCFLYDYTDL